MANNPYNKYKQNKYETASPEQLLLMLFEGAIKFCKQAKIGIEKKDIELTNNKIQRVQNIFFELMGTLDRDKGGEMADDLYGLYDYMNRRMIEANLKKDIEIIDEVQGLLEELHETWQEAAKKVNKIKQKQRNKARKPNNQQQQNNKQNKTKQSNGLNIRG